MWLNSLVLAAMETPPPAEPPAVPYDQIGLVLVAVVGAISAIIIAVIQRGNKTTPAPPSPPPGGFTLSEAEWITVRDRVLKLQSDFENLGRNLKDHTNSSDDVHNIFRRDLDNIKRELGIR